MIKSPNRDPSDNNNSSIVLQNLCGQKLTKKGEALAICVRSVEVVYNYYDLRLEHKTEYALRGVTLSVPMGTIYGLLGPSGCGKTTLLKCLFGYMPPTNGEIRIFGYKPGDKACGVPGSAVGYMPQDVALTEDLTIEEMLTYFGKIALMKDVVLRNRIDYLISFFNLPPKNRIIGTLSGGERRRASVATALVHDPRLLILDEPTVGVDPILRSKIWDKLVHLAKEQNVTTILTTHYIEEARRANNVGFMIKGQILAEDEPLQLIKKFQCNTLEDVFYTVRVEHQKLKESNMIKPKKVDYSELAHLKKVPWNSKHKADLGPIMAWWLVTWSITKRLAIQMIRHYEFVVCFMLVPVLALMITCVVFGSLPSGINIAVFNEEDPPFLSEIYLQEINPYVVTQHNVSSLEEGIQLVKDKKMWAVMHIRENFSEALTDRIFNFDVADNETIQQSIIKIYADVTDEIKKMAVEILLYEAFFYFVPQAATEMGFSPKLSALPIEIAEPIYGSFERGDLLSVRDVVAPGAIMCLAFVIGFCFTALALFYEKSGKVMERNYVAGVSVSQIVTGNILSRFFFGAIQSLLVMVIAINLFEVHCRGSFALAMALLCLQGFCGMVMGIFVSALVDEIWLITGFSGAIFAFSFIVSGIAWPVEALPYYFKWFSNFAPPTIPAKAMKNIMVRAHTFDMPSVYIGFIMTIFWTILFFILVILSFKYKPNLGTGGGL